MAYHKIRVGTDWQYPDDNAVRTWRAPHSGTIVISGRVRKYDTSEGDGVNVIILKNTTPVWPSYGN